MPKLKSIVKRDNLTWWPGENLWLNSNPIQRVIHRTIIMGYAFWENNLPKNFAENMGNNLIEHNKQIQHNKIAKDSELPLVADRIPSRLAVKKVKASFFFLLMTRNIKIIKTWNWTIYVAFNVCQWVSPHPINLIASLLDAKYSGAHKNTHHKHVVIKHSINLREVVNLLSPRRTMTTIPIKIDATKKAMDEASDHGK